MFTYMIHLHIYIYIYVALNEARQRVPTRRCCPQSRPGLNAAIYHTIVYYVIVSYIYIYIYIERERERYTCIYIYIYQ